MDAVHIEFLAPVVVIESVLFLLPVGRLGVAVAADLVGEGEKRVREPFETCLELLKAARRIAVAP